MKKNYYSLSTILKEYSPFLRFLLFGIIAALLSWKGQIFIHGNDKARELIINAFSILSGFLIAILTLYSDLQIDENANWRNLTLSENMSNRRYSKHSLLFYTYLLTLVCIFLTILLNHRDEYKDGKIIYFLEYVYLWLVCISLVYSAFLPSRLAQIRKERFQCILDSKKPKPDS